MKTRKRVGAGISRKVEELQLVDSANRKLQCVAFGNALTLALAGDAMAMFTVAYCLERGKGVEPNPESATFWLIRSATDVSPPSVALYRLATRHLAGTLDHSDVEYGLKLLARAAKAGHVAARKRLMLECESPAWCSAARKAAFEVVSELAGAASPNRYHVEAYLDFTRTYPASTIWDA